MSSYADAVRNARDGFRSGRTKSLLFREQQLKQLLRMYEENAPEFCAALAKDLRKSRQEAVIFEVEMLKNDVKNTLINLKDWAKPEQPEKSLLTMMDEVLIHNDPYGVVLVIGAWNFPLQVSLLPVAGAIAAGNCVILKPSELSPASASLMQKLIAQYLDPQCYQVICGGVAETTELLKERFDYIFYTGSTSVGKIVRAAANEHLTPVTLELGGKSPVYLDGSVNMDIAVKRILWGKCINAGQACIAPDYILCTKQVQQEFVSRAEAVLKEWYGSNARVSPDLCRIVSDRHFQRLNGFLGNSGKVAVGGAVDADDRFISPTVLVDVKGSDPIMQEEVFGPILPIITVEDEQQAVEFINAREKPLAFYIFSTDVKQQKRLMNDVTAGGICVNDVMMHAGVDTLPFGGVGGSGIGAYHGKFSFNTFTHKKGCLVKNLSNFGEKMSAARYPPYTDKNTNFMAFMMAKRRGIRCCKCLSKLMIFALGIAASFAVQALVKVYGSEEAGSS